MKHNFTFLAFCGGIGMGSDALKQCGGEELACIDYGDLQEQAFYGIHPSGCYMKMDMTTLTLDSFNEQRISMGLKPVQRGEVDVLLFSTPCTYMSELNNYRTPFNEMNVLTSKHIPRIIEEFQPVKGFICENTAALKTASVLRATYTELRQRLRKLNRYRFRDNILNSANYNCWTSRPRWIMYGLTDSAGSPISFPEPITVDDSKFHLNKLIPDAIEYTPGLYRKRFIDPYTGVILGKTEKWYDAKRILGTVTATGGEKIRLVDDTVRKLTIAELKTIFGIEHFNFGNISEADIHFLIGNGIVVPFMKVVAEHFLKQTLKTI